MKNKKILHIVSSLNVGGAERFVIDLCQAFSSTGDRVEILSFGSESDKLVEVANNLNLKVHCIKNATSLIGQIYLFKVLFRSDIIHLHTPRAINVLSIVIKFIARKPLIYTRHGAANLSSKQWQSVHAKFKKYVSHMTFVSQEGMEVFKKTYDWKDIVMEVVDNGVQIPEFPHTDTQEAIKIGSVGRFVSLKNQISLLKAVNLLPKNVKQAVEIHLFGDGECELPLKEYVKDHLANQKVFFHGMVESRDQIYNTFDLLCVTSETEGLSLAIMEAMAYGLPVLATDVGGNSKLVKHDINGWLFNYNDSEAISEHIIWAYENKEKLYTLGQSGRCYIKKAFSIDAAKNKYKNIYYTYK